jgi:hypothetical protein
MPQLGQGHCKNFQTLESNLNKWKETCLINTKSLILYFGLKSGLKCDKTNTNEVFSFRST